MKKFSVLSLSAILASNLFAQQNPELSLMLGNVKSDSDLNLKTEKNIGLRLQCKKVIKKFSFGEVRPEFAISRNLSKVDYKNSVVGDTDITRVGANAVLNLNNIDKITPYVLLGVGKEFVSTEKSENDDDGFFNFGAGIKYFINPKYSLRLEAQQIEHFDGDGDRFGIFAGITYKFNCKKNNNIDSDNDGVIDRLDRCPSTKEGVSVDEYGCKKPDNTLGLKDNKVIKEEKLILNVRFKVNSDQFLNNKAYKEIENFAKYLKDNNLYVVIEGYTSSDGDANANLKLSQKRADRVKAELVKLGVEPSKITAIGFGETNFITKNGTDPKNRRIEAVTFKTLSQINNYIDSKTK